MTRLKWKWRYPLGLIAAIIFAIVVREVGMALTARPGTAIDYAAKVAAQIEALQPKGTTPADPDAFRMFTLMIERLDRKYTIGQGPSAQRAGPLLVDLTPIYDPTERRRQAELNKNDSAYQAAEQAIAQLRAEGVDDALRQIAQTPRAVRPTQEGPLLEWLLPELGDSRKFARYSAARLALASERGDWPEYVDAYESCLALGRMNSRQPFLIARLVAVAISALANVRLRETLAAHELDEPTLLALIAALERQTSDWPSPAVQVEGERLMMLDTVQRTHTDNGRGDGRLIITEADRLNMNVSGAMPKTNWRIKNVLSIYMPRKRETVDTANAIYDHYAALAAQEPSQRTDRAAARATVTAAADKNRILAMLTPAIDKYLESIDRFNADLRVTRLVLAAHLYRARHGSFPASLDALVPAEIPAVPLDPWTGKPIAFTPAVGGAPPTITIADPRATGQNPPKGVDFAFPLIAPEKPERPSN